MVATDNKSEELLWLKADKTLFMEWDPNKQHDLRS